MGKFSVTINGFRSIFQPTTLTLGRLTILVGPPSSGKSNILEALLIGGYLNRIRLLQDEYGGSTSFLENLQRLMRFGQLEELLPYHMTDQAISLSWKVKGEEDGDSHQAFQTIQSNGDSGGQEILSLKYWKGGPWVFIKPCQLRLPFAPSTLVSLGAGISKELLKCLGETLSDTLYEARLYSFDKMGLGGSGSHDVGPLFYNYLSTDKNVVELPKNILSETAQNIRNFTRRHGALLDQLKIALEDLGVPIHIIVRRTGEVLFIDNNVEVSGSAISDTLYRLLYYTLGLLSSINFAHKHGMTHRTVVLLEEPEAHMFPFLMEPFVDVIRRALESIRVVIATHNPLLLSRLWDLHEDTILYYVYRDSKANMSTQLVKIDIKRLAKRLVTSDDLLLSTLSTVLEEYAHVGVE